MEENFDQWGSLKKDIHSKQSRPSFKQREIWWCHVGFNIGDEENGKGESYQRPVLVLKKFNNHIFFGIPLTSRIKDNYLYHKIYFKNKISSALLSQARTFESKRMIDMMGKLTTEEFEKVRKSLKDIL